MVAQPPTTCPGYQAWTVQAGPRSDITGSFNHGYPEANATYWGTQLTLSTGSIASLRGQYPQARYMSFQLYDGENVLDSINDGAINPDLGQNNPYRTGVAQGTYSVQVVFGRAPRRRPANTLYTGDLTSVVLLYRIYYPNHPDDLPGGPVNPVLPSITIGGVTLSNCPPLPVITPENTTFWGREDDIEFTGTKPTYNLPTDLQPQWRLSVTNPLTPYYPNQDNSYMWALLDRTFLKAPYNFDMVVIRMKAPTVPDTQQGIPVYAPADMRFWSMCTNEPMTTGVVRCVPDDRAINTNGFVTFVISDPSKRPSVDALEKWGAVWLPWGAIGPNDVIPDADRTWTNADGVFYYNLVLYRQTLSSPSFLQSIENVSKLPPTQWKDAMGDYWPTIGYCTAAAFQADGFVCSDRQ